MNLHLCCISLQLSMQAPSTMIGVFITLVLLCVGSTFDVDEQKRDFYSRAFMQSQTFTAARVKQRSAGNT